jgi:hypothetical protein
MPVIKYIPFRFVVFITLILGFAFCKKYKDPVNPPINLTNKYCNDPNAVNYNWGFPGIADNSVCFYPNKVFEGNYKMYDSVLQNDLYSFVDSFDVSIVSLNDTNMAIVQWCTNGDSVFAKANKNLRLTIDTTQNILIGQVFCQSADTINGTAIKTTYQDTVFNLLYTKIGATTNSKKAVFVKK